MGRSYVNLEVDLNDDLEDLNEDSTVTAEEFSYYLISIKEVLGYTKKKMAEFLGYKVETYSNYENGNTLPKNWERDWLKLQRKVKEVQNKKRSNPQFIESIDEDVGRKIIDMHHNGRNVVYIGTRLDIDEKKVFMYLQSKGYKPLKFSPVWG